MCKMCFESDVCANLKINKKNRNIQLFLIHQKSIQNDIHISAKNEFYPIPFLERLSFTLFLTADEYRKVKYQYRLPMQNADEPNVAV